ncbi:aminotransferase class I/II-fold pyridoxal phosphate-dependent enzyme, partial [Methanosalsum natronophilum]
GYVAANETYINQMLKVHQYVQACASSISQKAAVAAINGPIDDVIKMRKEFQRRRDFLLKSLKSMGIDCVEPKGAFYAFPYVGDDYLNIVSNLLSKGVIVVPGSAFGDKGKGYIRISYANSVENIKLAMEIMSDVIRH